MLNQLFNGKAGFVWGVRSVLILPFTSLLKDATTSTDATFSSRFDACSAAAFLGIALLTLANLLMRTRLPSRKQRATTFEPSIRRILTDVPFLVCALG